MKLFRFLNENHLGLAGYECDYVVAVDLESAIAFYEKALGKINPELVEELLCRSLFVQNTKDGFGSQHDEGTWLDSHVCQSQIDYLKKHGNVLGWEGEP